MKTFNESLAIFKTTISEYQKSCYKSDIVAFLFGDVGRNPGPTGYKRAETFIQSMEKAIREEKLSQTEELIRFAINYPDKGNILNRYIRFAVIASAGFAQKHIEHYGKHHFRWEESIHYLQDQLYQEIKKQDYGRGLLLKLENGINTQQFQNEQSCEKGTELKPNLFNPKLNQNKKPLSQDDFTINLRRYT
ncbi:MAG: hypothetical protein ACD_45C00008G0003 [uncultured bacterium]|nr:MAG: hypothetical protein ACD_45C00008G0003 [uncultured bacterium]